MFSWIPFLVDTNKSFYGLKSINVSIIKYMNNNLSNIDTYNFVYMQYLNEIQFLLYILTNYDQ